MLINVYFSVVYIRYNMTEVLSKLVIVSVLKQIFSLIIPFWSIVTIQNVIVASRIQIQQKAIFIIKITLLKKMNVLYW